METKEKIDDSVEKITEAKSMDLQDIEEKPYACNTCKAYFFDKELYEAHLLTHSIEKRFRCKHCAKSFSTCNNLQKHCQNVHGTIVSSEVSIVSKFSTDFHLNPFQTVVIILEQKHS